MSPVLLLLWQNWFISHAMHALCARCLCEVGKTQSKPNGERRNHFTGNMSEKTALLCNADAPAIERCPHC
jgi:hypothetical protein